MNGLTPTPSSTAGMGNSPHPPFKKIIRRISEQDQRITTSQQSVFDTLPGRHPPGIIKKRAQSEDVIPDKRLTSDRRWIIRSEPNLPNLTDLMRDPQCESVITKKTSVEISSGKMIRLQFDFRKPDQPEITIQPTTQKISLTDTHKSRPDNPTRRRIKRTQSMAICGKQKGWTFPTSKDVNPMAIDDLATIEKKKPSSLFNIRLETGLKKEWQSEKKSPLSAMALEAFIEGFCFDMICNLFHEENLGQLGARDFEIRREEITEQILEHISQNGIPLLPILKRYHIILKALKKHFEESNYRTEESQAFYHAIEQMVFKEKRPEDEITLTDDISIEMDLKSFLQRYRGNHEKKIFGKLLKFFKAPLGEKRSIRGEILHTLDTWASPPAEKRRAFSNNAEEIFKTLLRAQNITLLDNFWIEDPEAKMKVGNISHYNIFSSIMFNTDVWYQTISVNDEPLDLTSKSKSVFYEQLFIKLYKAAHHSKTAPEGYIEALTEYACDIVGEKEVAPPQAGLPLIRMLIPCSISAWIHAHNYLIFLFPSFSKPPLSIREWKEEPRRVLKCRLNITSESDYNGVIDKSYAIFETSPSGLILDRDKPLAFLTVRWKISLHQQGSRIGCLTNPRHIQFANDTPPQLRKQILNTLANPTDPEHPRPSDRFFGKPQYMRTFRHTRDYKKL